MLRMDLIGAVCTVHKMLDGWTISGPLFILSTKLWHKHLFSNNCTMLENRVKL